MRALCKMAIYHAAVRQTGRGYARLRGTISSSSRRADATDDDGKDDSGVEEAKY